MEGFIVLLLVLGFFALGRTILKGLKEHRRLERDEEHALFFFEGQILIDSNIFLEEDPEKQFLFFGTLLHCLNVLKTSTRVRFSSSIVLPKECYEEIYDIKLKRKDHNARRGQRLVQFFQERGLLQIPGLHIEKERKSHADPAIIRYIRRKAAGSRENFLLYSKDIDLKIRARELLKEVKSFRCFDIEEAFLDNKWILLEQLSEQDVCALADIFKGEWQRMFQRNASAKVTSPKPYKVTSSKLYVGNLSIDADESDLKDLFGRSAPYPPHVSIVTHRDAGESKRFGLVTMYSIEAAVRAAAELHDKEFMGRRLFVSGGRPDQ